MCCENGKKPTDSPHLCVIGFSWSCTRFQSSIDLVIVVCLSSFTYNLLSAFSSRSCVMLSLGLAAQSLPYKQVKFSSCPCHPAWHHKYFYLVKRFDASITEQTPLLRNDGHKTRHHMTTDALYIDAIYSTRFSDCHRLVILPKLAMYLDRFSTHNKQILEQHPKSKPKIHKCPACY